MTMEAEDVPVDSASGMTVLGPLVKELTPADKENRLTWVKDGIYYTHLVRRRDQRIWRKAELYDGCRQWLRPGRSGLDLGYDYYTQWVEAFWESNDPRKMPTPVMNDGFDKRVSESARLAKPQYRPVVYPKALDPTIAEKTGAKRLKDMLRSRLDDMNWESEEDLMALHAPLYGGAWILSRWEETYAKTSLVPLTTAKKCPNCDFLVSNAVTPLKPIVQKFGMNAPSLTEAHAPDMGMVTKCLTCEDHPPLQDFSPNLYEAGTMKDAFDRDLGERKPSADWTLKVVSPYDVFPYNLGYDMRPGGIDEFTYVHAEKMAWIYEHYPYTSKNVKPENPAALMMFHPVGGSPELLGSLLDGKTFRDMARVKERVRFPSFQKRTVNGKDVFQMDMGRHVVVCNEEVLFDGPLMMKSVNREGMFVPRIYMDYVPWEIIDGGRRIQGLSQWQLMFDAQNIVNETTSQTQSVRRHMALPMYAIPRDANYEEASLDLGVPGQFVTFEVEPGDDPSKYVPHLFNSMTIPSGVKTELDSAREFLDRIAPTVEQGQAQPGVDSAKANRLLLEEAGTKREPRTRRIKQALVRLFTHGANLQQNFYGPEDPRECRFRDEDGQERWEAFTGLQLGESVVIDVEPSQPDIEERRMGVTNAITNQVIAPQSSPQMQRKLVALLAGDKVAEELYEDETLQENSAKREWQDFRDKGVSPAVDPTLDDNLTHFQEHGRSAHTEYFRSLELEADWDGVLNVLGDSWTEDLQAVMMTPIPGLPLSLQERIQMMWGNKLMQSPTWPNPEKQEVNVDSLIKVMSWRAHTEAHRLYEEKKQMMAMAQQVQLAAPGGDATASGTQVTPMAPPADAAGGPGVGAEGRLGQQKQQLEAKAMAASQGQGVPAEVMTQPMGG